MQLLTNIKNTAGKWLVPTLALATAGTIAIGCSLDRMIKVPVTDGLAGLMGETAGHTVSLYETPFFLEECKLKIKHELIKFSDNIDDALATHNFFAGVWASIEQQASVVLPGLPAGALLLSALTGAGALFVDRPGTKRRLEEARNGGNGVDPKPPTA
jgi:hypothetical protein